MKHTIKAAPTTPWRTKSGCWVGRLHKPAPLPNIDRDALRLQRALLGEKEPRDWDGIAIVVGVCLLIALVMGPLWFR
jgi:hypothetical protein